MRVHSVSFLMMLCLTAPCAVTAQRASNPDGRVATDVRMHETEEWHQISLHLPDPKLAPMKSWRSPAIFCVHAGIRWMPWTTTAMRWSAAATRRD